MKNDRDCAKVIEFKLTCEMGEVDRLAGAGETHGGADICVSDVVDAWTDAGGDEEDTLDDLVLYTDIDMVPFCGKQTGSVIKMY